MKFSTLLLFAALLSLPAYSQVISFYFTAPIVQTNNANLFQQERISQEQIYRYDKKTKNNDSLLLERRYFDSSGHCIEEDEVGKDGRTPVQITNYFYSGDLLLKIERQSMLSFVIADSLAAPTEVTTMDYDSMGNQVAEKRYAVSGGGNVKAVEEFRKEYDDRERVSKLFVKTDKQPFYLYKSYRYEGEDLKEIKSYTTEGKWNYSELLEYDTSAHKLSKYRFNGDVKTLEEEQYFDGHKNVLRDVMYTARMYLDHNTVWCGYGDMGLLLFQRTQFANGKNVYFKHYYLRQ